MPASVTEKTDPGSFHQTVYSAFQQAEASAGVTHEQDYLLGGRRVRLHFAGGALLPSLTPALAHREVPVTSAAPDLTVCLWDGATTGVPLPTPPWATEDYRERRTVRGYNDERFQTAFDITAGSLSLLDTATHRAIYATRAAAELPQYERGAPLLLILHWWWRTLGWQITHAAAIGLQGQGVLLAGRGGSGKSTTALNCLAAGWQYVADDYCLLEAEPTPYAHTLFNSGKLTTDSLTRFPELTALGRETLTPATEPSGKALVFLRECLPQQITDKLALRAVLLPRVTGTRDTQLKPASAAAGLRALAPSTIFQLANADQTALRTLAALVRRLPCYHLELGTELAQIPAAIERLLSTPNL